MMSEKETTMKLSPKNTNFIQEFTIVPVFIPDGDNIEAHGKKFGIVVQPHLERRFILVMSRDEITILKRQIINCLKKER